MNERASSMAKVERQRNAKASPQIGVVDWRPDESLLIQFSSKRKQSSSAVGPLKKREVKNEANESENEVFNQNKSEEWRIMTLQEKMNMRTYVLTVQMFYDKTYEKFIVKAEKFLKSINPSKLTKRQLVLKALLAFRKRDFSTLGSLLKNNAFPTPYIGFLKQIYLYLGRPCRFQFPFIIASDDSEKLKGVEAIRDAHLQEILVFEFDRDELADAAGVLEESIDQCIMDEEERMNKWYDLEHWLERNEGIKLQVDDE